MKNRIKVCHLASYFDTNQLYARMVDNLSALGVEQSVYSPRGFENQVSDTNMVSYRGEQIWTKLDSYLFLRKIRKYNDFLAQNESIKSSNLCHAHSLFSDGMSAYKLKQAHNIPYVITVRNTDLRIFARYFIHLRTNARSVIENASGVIFANHNYPDRLAKLLDMKIDRAKVKVIPNGLDPFWFETINTDIARTSSTINVLSVGNVIKLKNHITLIHAINNYNDAKTDKCPEMKLTIVGNCESLYGRYLKSRYQSRTISFTGSLPFTEIVSLMRSSTLFALLSWRENFGIAYAEAVSQGLPIIYTKREGFDGWVDEGVWGYSCEHNDGAGFVKLALKLSQKNIPTTASKKLVSDLFDWNNITKDIKNIYVKTLE